MPFFCFPPKTTIQSDGANNNFHQYPTTNEFWSTFGSTRTSQFDEAFETDQIL